MQTRTRIAGWLDKAALSFLLFTLSFLFFAVRLENLIGALLLSLAVTGLMLYAFYLLQRASNGRRSSREATGNQRKAALYALSVLPYQQALAYAIQSLLEEYPLQRLYAVEDACYLADSAKDHIAAVLEQSPCRIGIKEVHLCHKAHRTSRCILLCVGGFQPEADAYARSLDPALRLVDVGQLPLPQGILHAESAQQAQKQHTVRAVLQKLLHPAQAMRCMLFSLFLLIGYIFTDQLACLFPGLLLAFFALLCKKSAAPGRTLF